MICASINLLTGHLTFGIVYLTMLLLEISIVLAFVFHFGI